MEKIMEEGTLQRQRASVPAFGEWDQMKAAGVLPDYSMDFTKIRAARMQRKSMPSLWSSAGSAPEVVGGGDDDDRNHVKQHSEHGDDDRRHCHHRRQHSDGTDLRRPLRPEAPKARSKVKDYLFGCVGGW
ncbi:uncharacterized protein [Lolium perenne]|uniref:uncharacterized protein isoform X2 n=1 Tax=Lolium perenne TaxID=4522 RepID=UPI0021F5F534|nr:uncharacterized protein LOC127295267 isoform X2 [Lolium perenne]